LGCAYEDCGDPAEVAWGIPLCPPHRSAHSNWIQNQICHEIVRYFRQRPDAEESPGWTYAAILPNGRWKIGFTEQEVDRRLQKLHKIWRGRLTPVAVLPGGRTREARLHFKYKHCRVMTEAGEQFEPDAEMRAEVLAFGIHPGAVEAVARYSKYEPRLRGTSDKAAPPPVLERDEER
jgi:hypothetical protein